MFVDKSQVSLTLVYLDSEAEKNHALWINSARRRGKRIALENKNLSKANLRGSDLTGACFIHCNFSNSFFDRVDFISAQIDDCIFNESGIYGGDYRKASVKNCQFIKVQAKLSDFILATIDECNWKDSDCMATEWSDAKVADCCFSGVEFERSRFHQTHFENCDFSNTRLNAVEAYGTTFKNCDFRHADLNGFILQDATFFNCGFYGSRNKPDMQGKVFITNPDLSENYDGSDIVTEATILNSWR